MNKPPANPVRQKKLAAKLKENLRRRKGQAKVRNAALSDSETDKSSNANAPDKIIGTE